MNPELVTGSCGDVCSFCPRYLATLSGDPDELRRTAELWRDVGLRDRVVPNEEIRCEGCSPTNACRSGIAACASERQLVGCAMCAEHPCPKLEQPFARTEASMRELGARSSPQMQLQLERAFGRKRALVEALGRLLK